MCASASNTFGGNMDREDSETLRDIAGSLDRLEATASNIMFLLEAILEKLKSGTSLQPYKVSYEKQSDG
jgi:hypothetical protein